MSTAQEDISRWLVTPENPPRGDNALDYERCAALHNYIVELGWIGSGKSINDLPRRTWFDIHGEEAEEQRENLHSSVIAFLERVWDVTEVMCFFYWVSSLSSPHQLWEDHCPDLYEEGEEHRFFTLYPMNVGFGEHSDGLNYDQHHFKAIVQVDILDDEITRREDDPPSWYPLETILSAWIDMIHIGKVQAVQKGTEVDNEVDHLWLQVVQKGTKSDCEISEYDIHHPWLLSRFSERQVRDVLSAYHKLVRAIESRMGMQTDQQETRGALISDQVLDNAHVPANAFARSFLSRAQRPQFRHIAPGLSLPNPESFVSSRVFTDIDNDDEDRKPVPPIRVFEAEGSLSITRGNTPFDAPYNTFLNVPCGLYIPNADLTIKTIEEASARLVLPFSIGGKGHARRSDTSRFENAIDLYQPGFSPFSGDWSTPTRLVRVLKKWRQNVKSMEWQVGPDGVEGGIEKFKEADTEDGWEKYYLAPDW